ncbi:MAG: dockerin type I repeat-containing protein, partial [Oscillospiraceae bacterium]|nr:dockerin type I repeat-containing protein [Oscillospiraceae bacterium]
MEDGTYKDQVGGGTFTVSNGKITGTVGSTGVAVVYNTTQNPVKPTEAPTTIAPTTVPVKQVLIGDVNGDGIISVYDATLIQRHASELITLTGNQFTAADASRDNLVSVYDATAVQRYAGEFTTGIEYCGTYV